MSGPSQFLSRVGSALLVLTMTLGLSVTLAAPGASAETAGNDCSTIAAIYEGTSTIMADPASANPGDTIEITGRGFPPGVPIVIQVGTTDVATVTPDAQGNFVAPITVPMDASGEITICATCDPLKITTTVKVLGEDVTRVLGEQRLPKTGSNAWPLTRLAVALVLVGAGLVFVTRRRTSRDDETMDSSVSDTTSV
ncbi:MAG: LPXTG cell wall anchor domain-containing protein [Actinomycetes bacterium]